MNMHQNSRLTPKGRELLIERLEREEYDELKEAIAAYKAKNS